MLNKPKKTQYPSFHNLKKPQNFKLNSKLLKTKFALMSCENNILTAAQLAAAVLTIKRKIKNNLKFLIRVFPHLPVTKRPLELPLGKGKASIAYWATPINVGTILFELEAEQIIIIKTALKAASYKLPFKTQIIQKLEPN